MIFHFQIFRWVRIQEILNLDEEDWFAMVDDDSDWDEEDDQYTQEIKESISLSDTTIVWNAKSWSSLMGHMYLTFYFINNDLFIIIFRNNFLFIFICFKIIS